MSEWDKGMTELFSRAEREGLWFHSRYQNLWFSPASLKMEHADGHFRWGAMNWELRDPEEHLKRLYAKAYKAMRKATAFEKVIRP